VLTIERTVGPDNVRTLDFPLVRARVDFPAVESRMLESPDKIGYVYLAEFYEKAADMLSDQLDDLKKQGMRALVLDMRDDPGGLLVQAMDVAGQFLDGKSVVIVRERNGEEQTLFARRSRYKELRVPLVVLVNSHSASASEIVAGALKDHKAATTVGDRTFGKGLVQTLEPLKGGSAVAITTARYFTPNHVNINPRRDADGNVIEGGLAPDIEVKQNPDYEYGKDETDWQLKKAVEVLRKQLRTGG
jgi:carboxyl-terminal processing protease